MSVQVPTSALVYNTNVPVESFRPLGIGAGLLVIIIIAVLSLICFFIGSFMENGCCCYTIAVLITIFTLGFLIIAPKVDPTAPKTTNLETRNMTHEVVRFFSTFFLVLGLLAVLINLCNNKVQAVTIEIPQRHKQRLW